MANLHFCNEYILISIIKTPFSLILHVDPLTYYGYHVFQSSKRTITQFHYTAWPDHDTPEELGLVQFHRAVTKQYQSGGLMLVHCR